MRPILGRVMKPRPWVVCWILNPALRVNRADWRERLDLNRGAPTFRPLRLPFRELKKLR